MRREDAAEEGVVVEVRQDETRPEAVWVAVHQGDMEERMDGGVWITVWNPGEGEGSSGVRSKEVRRQERERITSV